MTALALPTTITLTSISGQSKDARDPPG